MDALHWDRALSDLTDHGLTITVEERKMLDAAPENARPHLLGLIRRAMTTSGVPSTVVRYRAPYSSSAENIKSRIGRHPWEVSADGTSFHHRPCGTSFGGYEGSYQSLQAAVDHHRQCTPPKGRHHAQQEAGHE